MSLEARGVAVRFNDARSAALDDISLVLNPGEFVALAGANGSGKSTLLRTLAGALTPDHGRILLDARDLIAPAPAAIQFVQQNVEDHIVAPVVRDDVAFGPECLGLADDEVARRVAEALATIGLQGFEDRAVETLSGGELTRLALAGALAMRPSYLLVDEPTAHLDPLSANRIVDLLRRLADGGMGVLLVSHRLEEARGACRLLLMHDGRLVAEGSPRELLYDRARLGDAGLAPPPIVDLVEDWRAAGRSVTGAPLDLDELLAAAGPAP
jgi:energy-coupling factor transport system ATP-binding protein